MESTVNLNIGTPLFYMVFSAIVVLMLLIDAFLLKRNGTHKVAFKEALIWSILWVAVSAIFATWLYFALANNEMYGTAIAKEKVMEFATAYLLEKSLSVDNIFVFLMIFSYFNTPSEYQHRVLLFGVLGAIVFRLIVILLGVILVQKFAWILYVFGAFLVFSGIKMMLPEKEEDKDLSDNPLLKLFRRIFRISKDFNQEYFFTRENGKLLLTPLFLVLLMIESSDIIFAVDSIPAVFSVSNDPFIIITSNILAILGLRAMYFLLAGAADRFVFLQYGLAFVLFFIGVKMLIAHFIHIPIAISLSVVFGAIGASVMISLKHEKKVKNNT